MTSKIQQLVFNSINTNLNVVNNYISSLSAEYHKINLDIKFEDMQLLNFARDSALSKGVITEEENKISIRANLNLNNQKYEVRLSPTGQNLDMIGDNDKRAYKAKVLNGKKILGMSEFKLLPPTSRHHMVEWIGHAIENKEGLISLRYFFVQVRLNGENKGIYAIEEHLNKELLENRGAREGIIFSIKNNKVRIFNENRIKKNKDNNNQIRFLKTILQTLKNDQLNVERIFDLEKFSTQYAIIDLMYGYHALGNNPIFYLNPITNLIEPITREYNSLRYSEGQPVEDLMIEKYRRGAEGFNFVEKLFNNKEFVKLYIAKLEKFSKKNYLDKFFYEIHDDMNAQLKILYREYPFYKFPKEYMYVRQQQIKKKLEQDLKIIANVNSDFNNFLSLKFKNNSVFPVKITQISSSKKIIKNLNQIVYAGKEIDMMINNKEKIKIDDLDFSYKIENSNNSVRKSIIVPKSYSKDLIVPILWSSPKISYLEKFNIFTDEKNKKIFFKENNIKIDENIFIPENFTVYGKSGLKIDLINGSTIYSKSPFKFIGNKNRPIEITSSDLTSGGIVILNSNNKNIFENVIFNNLRSPNIKTSGLTASVTIYESETYFNNCLFENNKSEDFLNLVRSKYEINNSIFRFINSDAVDSDFSKGKIINTEFYNIGNDVIDFSGSTAEISELYIDGAGDKVLSAGEKSTVLGKNISIKNSEIGITSKDLSEVIINDIKIDNTRLAFAIFQKKAEYGVAKAVIKNLLISNVEEKYLVEIGSSLKLNEKNIIGSISNVSDQLYGSSFGKSSK
tara:strand:+ start:2023 stop:4398 length:2376 start_codon:yes stop_codon:yes gene_type:complete